MIVARNIIKDYTNGRVVTHVLRGIDVDIKTGEFVGIMGKSGAGKSTLMYQLSLLDKPTSGSIEIDGVDVIALSEKESTTFRLTQLGYVFQDYALVPELTALENIMVPLLMLGMSKAQARKTALESLDRVGLVHRPNNTPNRLSGGEQQRVSIARAVAQEPKILFADEPTANLDSVSGQHVIDIISELHKQGQTVVMVTHEKEYAVAAERIIYLEDGEIVEEEYRHTTIEKAQKLV